MPSFACTAVIAGEKYGVAKATLGEKGYKPMPEFGLFETYAEAQKKARILNNGLGLPPDLVSLIVLSTMNHEERYPAPINEVTNMVRRDWGSNFFKVTFVVEEQNEEMARTFIQSMFEDSNIGLIDDPDFDIEEIEEPKFR